MYLLLQFDDAPDEIAGDEVDAVQVYVLEFDVDEGDDLQTELIVSQVLKSLENNEPIRFRRSAESAHDSDAHHKTMLHHQVHHMGRIIEARANK